MFDKCLSNICQNWFFGLAKCYLAKLFRFVKPNVANFDNLCMCYMFSTFRICVQMFHISQDTICYFCPAKIHLRRTAQQTSRRGAGQAVPGGRRRRHHRRGPAAERGRLRPDEHVRALHSFDNSLIVHIFSQKCSISCVFSLLETHTFQKHHMLLL